MYGNAMGEEEPRIVLIRYSRSYAQRQRAGNYCE